MLGGNKTFIKKTRRGKVLKVVKEHYLRDDISDGVGTVLETNAPCYIIPDTNVVLHQIDLLENPSITNVIILSTVLDETKNQNVSIYHRLRNIIKNEKKHFYVFSNEHHKATYVERRKNESINDRNDRAIRVAALWYIRKLSESKPIFLITNDRENFLKAKQEDIPVKTIHDYVRELTTHPELLDLLNYSDELPSDEGVETGKMAKKKALYEEHKPLSVIKAGIQDKTIFQGKLHVKRNNPFEASIAVSGLSEGDTILIKGWENMNRAVAGDIVAVQLLPKEKWTAPSAIVTDRDKEFNETVTTGMKKPTGKVVGIIKRNWRTYCGSLDENTECKDGLQKVLFVPIDSRIPKIRIQTRQAKALITKRITVAIDHWDVNSKYPDGHYVGTIGDIGDANVESEVILLEHDIPHYDFPESVLKCLPPDDWCITEEEVKKRRDLRHLHICSVDPPGCKDVDDALHAVKLSNGNYEIGVHIADVTHFVRPGTALDAEAAKRGTTVYLVDRRIDMLPKVLTENLCSLLCNVDRLAFSVIWEMTPKAEILKVDFCKSVIRSRAKLTYSEAQMIIDDKTQTSKIAQSLRILRKISKILKQNRNKKGALTLASPQYKFDLDTETHNPTDVSLYQLQETNSMVEEFMLLANIEVAKKIYKDFPLFSLLRRHPAPSPSKFEKLLKSLSTVGVKLNIENSKSLAESLDKAVIQGREYFNTLVRILTTRCMELAVYFPSGDFAFDDFYHYGLATPIYTHFTSPIRRYADDVVHRLLAASIGVEPLDKSLTDREKLRALCESLNERHNMAQHADRASAELYTHIYFRDKTVIEDAYIIKITANAVMLFIPRYGIEGIVYVCEPDEKSLFTYNNDTETLELKSHNIKLRMFDKVKAKICVKTFANYRRKLHVMIVDPPLDKFLEKEETKKRKVENDSQQPTKKLKQ